MEGSKFEWHFGDGFKKTFFAPAHKYMDIDSFTVKCIGISPQGCKDSLVKEKYISIQISPISKFEIENKKVLIPGFKINFTNLSTIAKDYVWSFGDSTTSTQRNPTKIYLTGGSKLVQLTISDTTQGCFDTYYDSLFLLGPTVYCSARFEVGFDTTTPFQFSILNTSFVRPNSTYLWSFGDGESSNLLAPSHTYATFGSYLVCLTVSDSLCTSTFCDSVGMDSSGTLLKQGKFGFVTLNRITILPSTGFTAVNSDLEYSVYPNPTSNLVTIELNQKNSSQVKLILTDLSGKILLNKEVQAPSGLWSESI
ncbi:MAG: PKD domain-containing protein [Bacteroidetes bacterium]|nr:PKD domain-containing protein [Bacteroidota bacterium]